MGRYFQTAPFPPADQTVTAAFATVNGSSTPFHSSGGVHLIYGRVRILDNSALDTRTFLHLRLDAVTVAGTEHAVQIHPTEQHDLTICLLLEIPAGPHTLDLQVADNSSGVALVTLNDGRLFAIEFPSWESADRIGGP